LNLRSLGLNCLPFGVEFVSSSCVCVLAVLTFFSLFSFSLRYNCLDKQAAILESMILKSKECQVKKLL